jgi:hypothetical protein
MNATEEVVARYVEELHRTLRDVSGRFFSAEESKRLLHNSLLPATITCYVSTQFGVGFEYSTASETQIKTVRGSARVEDLFVQSPKRLRQVGPSFIIAASLEMGQVVLSGGFPFLLSREQASATFWKVHFKSEALNWKRYVEYAEIYGDRRASRWSPEAAQSRAKDEVLAALFLAQRAEKANKTLDEFVSSFREKHVLVLGAYNSAGEKRLRDIAACLEELGYEPVFVKDIPDFEHYDLAQKVVAIGALSRFIVIDDSSPSGHLNEFEFLRPIRWITVVLRANGIAASSMTLGASVASNVIREASYDPSNPKPAIEEAIKWAEDRLSELKEKFHGLYPWRQENRP